MRPDIPQIFRGQKGKTVETFVLQRPLASKHDTHLLESNLTKINPSRNRKRACVRLVFAARSRENEEESGVKSRIKEVQRWDHRCRKVDASSWRKCFRVSGELLAYRGVDVSIFARREYITRIRRHLGSRDRLNPSSAEKRGNSEMSAMQIRAMAMHSRGFAFLSRLVIDAISHTLLPFPLLRPSNMILRTCLWIS